MIQKADHSCLRGRIRYNEPRQASQEMAPLCPGEQLSKPVTVLSL